MKSFVRLLPLVLLALLLIACPETNPPNFSLALSPQTLSLDTVSVSKTSALKVNKLNAFNSAVTFRVKTVPEGLTASLSNVQADSATVNVRVLKVIAARDYTITLEGKSGALTKTVDLIVKVNIKTEPTTEVVAPSKLALAAKDAGITLNWQDNSDNETGFVIERRISGRAYATWKTVAANITSAQDSDFLYDEVYEYRVKAIKDAVASSYSNEISYVKPSPLQEQGKVTIKVVPNTNLALKTKDNYQLEAVVIGKDGQPVQNPAVTWQSADAKVATISATGLVNAIANGSSRITATYDGVTSAPIHVSVVTMASTSQLVQPNHVLSAEVAVRGEDVVYTVGMRKNAETSALNVGQRIVMTGEFDVSGEIIAKTEATDTISFEIKLIPISEHFDNAILVTTLTPTDVNVQPSSQALARGEAFEVQRLSTTSISVQNTREGEIPCDTKLNTPDGPFKLKYSGLTLNLDWKYEGFDILVEKQQNNKVEVVTQFRPTATLDFGTLTVPVPEVEASVECDIPIRTLINFNSPTLYGLSIGAEVDLRLRVIVAFKMEGGEIRVVGPKFVLETYYESGLGSQEGKPLYGILRAEKNTPAAPDEFPKPKFEVVSGYIETDLDLKNLAHLRLQSGLALVLNLNVKALRVVKILELKNVLDFYTYVYGDVSFPSQFDIGLGLELTSPIGNQFYNEVVKKYLADYADLPNWNGEITKHQWSHYNKKLSDFVKDISIASIQADRTVINDTNAGTLQLSVPSLANTLINYIKEVRYYRVDSTGKEHLLATSDDATKNYQVKWQASPLYNGNAPITAVVVDSLFGWEWKAKPSTNIRIDYQVKAPTINKASYQQVNNTLQVDFSAEAVSNNGADCAKMDYKWEFAGKHISIPLAAMLYYSYRANTRVQYLSSGEYKVVVTAKDKCGGVAQKELPLNLQSNLVVNVAPSETITLKPNESKDISISATFTCPDLSLLDDESIWQKVLKIFGVEGGRLKILCNFFTHLNDIEKVEPLGSVRQGDTTTNGYRYTAANSSEPITDTVRFVSGYDQSVMRTVTFNVVPAVSVDISFADENKDNKVSANSTTAISANVRGGVSNLNRAVRWSIETVTGGDKGKGSIQTANANGNSAFYTAPEGTGTFKITATSVAVPSAKASITVTVVGAPIIIGFAAEKATINQGESTKLLFRVRNTEKVKITSGSTVVVERDTNNLGEVNLSHVVSPTTTTTYRLQAVREGTTVSKELTVTVAASNTKPIADFTFTPTAPVAGQAVTFNAKAHSSNSAVKYGFNFGDGSNSVVNTTGTATHTFATAGSYNVRLQVEDAKGVKSETKVKVVQVQANANPQDWKLLGNASMSNGRFIITPDAEQQNGAIWNKADKLDFTQDFQRTFMVYLGNEKNGEGGDGIVLALLKDIPSRQGAAGAFLGFGWDELKHFESGNKTPLCNQCIGIELDSFYNSDFDPTSNDHIALVKNGSTVHTNTVNKGLPYKAVTLADGKEHKLSIVWAKSTKNLAIYLDDALMFDYVIESITDTFGSNVVHYGFTGATWSATNLQYFLDYKIGGNNVIASQQVVVPGTANPLLAGKPNGTTCCNHPGESVFDKVPEQAPVLLNFDVSKGRRIIFKVSGQVGNLSTLPTTNITPDGGEHIDMREPNTGIAPALNIPLRALAGVFLTNTEPQKAPQSLKFVDSLGLKFATLSPQIGQVFFIGDGLTGTSTGSIQEFNIPNSATRLFLGSVDGVEWSNNSGKFTVIAELLE